MIEKLVDKMKDVKPEDLRSPLVAVMNTFLALKHLREEDPSIDLRASVTKMKSMNQSDIREQIWNYRKYLPLTVCKR